MLAKRWKCHPTAIDYRVKTGSLEFHKINNRKVYSIDEIERLEKEKPIKSQGKRPPKRPVPVFENTDSILTKILKFLKLI